MSDISCTLTSGANIVLKTHITPSSGVWRIKRAEHSSVIEVYRYEDSGHGGILTPSFVAWRRELAGMEAAKSAAASVNPSDGSAVSPALHGEAGDGTEHGV